MKAKSICYITDRECPRVCERCGAPIAHQTIIVNEHGTEHVYGSTCGQRMLGNAAAERATREAMERRERESRRLKRHVKERLKPKRCDLYREYLTAEVDGDVARVAKIKELIDKHGRYLDERQ